MKIHIYKSQLDKIPVNAIPFYPSDSIELYGKVRTFYDRDPLPAKNCKFVSKEEYKGNYNIDNKFLETNVDILMLGKESILLYKEEKAERGLAILVDETTYFDYEGFLPAMCNHYFPQGYSYVSFSFFIEHRKRPNIKKGEFDFALKTGNTDEDMGMRTYVVRNPNQISPCN